MLLTMSHQNILLYYIIYYIILLYLFAMCQQFLRAFGFLLSRLILIFNTYLPVTIFLLLYQFVLGLVRSVKSRRRASHFDYFRLCGNRFAQVEEAIHHIGRNITHLELGKTPLRILTPI